MCNMNEIERIDAYFRAANYVALGQLYLVDNPLLKRPLKMSDLKKKLVGHWGTVPGQNFIYTHWMISKLTTVLEIKQ